VGTNGILIPPGYMQGLRKICDRHGILHRAVVGLPGDRFTQVSIS
jgi:hypothetical protein